jgi:hypothetical protein
MKIRVNDLTTVPRPAKPDRRRFIGGSDARIIMAPDAAALIRLWKESAARPNRRTSRTLRGPSPVSSTVPVAVAATFSQACSSARFCGNGRPGRRRSHRRTRHHQLQGNVLQLRALRGAVGGCRPLAGAQSPRQPALYPRVPVGSNQGDPERRGIGLTRSFLRFA